MINLNRKIIIFIFLHTSVWPVDNSGKITEMEYSYYVKKHNYLEYELFESFKNYKIGISEWHDNILTISLYDENLKFIRILKFNEKDLGVKWVRNLTQVDSNKILLYGTQWDSRQKPVTIITMIDQDGKILRRNSFRGVIELIDEPPENFLNLNFFFRDYSLTETEQHKNIGIISIDKNLDKIKSINYFPEGFIYKYYEKKFLLPVKYKNENVVILSDKDLSSNSNEYSKKSIFIFGTPLNESKWSKMQILNFNDVLKKTGIMASLDSGLLDFNVYFRSFTHLPENRGIYTVMFELITKGNKKRRNKKIFHVLLFSNKKQYITEFKILPPEYGNQIIGVSGDYIYTVDNLPDNRVKIMKIKYSDFLKNLK